MIQTLSAVRSAKRWSLKAPRHEGTFLFGPGDGAAAETVVFGVFGDSVGCGLGVPDVGRTFAGDVARRLAETRRVVCRIRAKSGARGRHLASQLPAGDEDFAAISIGTNDIIHGESLARLERSLCEFLERLGGARRVVVLGPGDVTSSMLVPPVMRRLLARRVRLCEDALRRAAEKFPHARHFGPADLGVAMTPAHFAVDGFHPSEAAHALIAEHVFSRLVGEARL